MLEGCAPQNGSAARSRELLVSTGVKHRRDYSSGMPILDHDPHFDGW
jgi:hypothetical protein